MRALARHAVIALTLVAFTGCAIVQPVEDLSPAAIQQQVRPGDVVHVEVRDGRTFELTVDKVESASLTGTTLDDRRFRIAYASITVLQVRNPGQAAAGAGAMTVGVLAYIVLIVAGGIWLVDEVWNQPE
jgi:hypothetical protein